MATATTKQSKRSLHRRHHKLADPQAQLDLLNKNHKTNELPTFGDKLNEIGMTPFRPSGIEILQMNVGYMCDLSCSHCHVDAGPDRKEIMSEETMQQCLDALDMAPDIHTVDLTGGAPEMNPNFQWFVEEVTKRGRKTIVRSNLTILVSNKKFREFPQFFKDRGVAVVASLPCYTPDNTDKQRGDGVFKRSIEALAMLNEHGFGKEGTGLELDLVYNPLGFYLPPSQEDLEQDYKRQLKKHFDIAFNNLYTITNLPISRFLESLVKAGKEQEYMDLLVNSFNPAAVGGVMCRNTLSVRWDGKLYDCDFNQMLEIGTDSNVPQYIGEFDKEALNNRNIQIDQHCFGCTAGAGSSCQGSLT
jgi:radical SAM/Cys-rich protein